MKVQGSTLIVAWLLALDWLRLAISALRGMPQLPDLVSLDMGSLPPLAASEGADLAVIVPACNEEEATEPTLRSLLAQTGIRLQIIAVDVRSTDSTAERIERLIAGSGQRANMLELVRNRDLPPGWLGKTNAMRLGLARVRAPWVLFTDGDLTFAPDALERSLRTAFREEADHFVLFPTLVSNSLVEAAIQSTMQATTQWSVRLWRVSDESAKDFLGIGGFNMVRMQAIERLGGLERLRMEVIEDLSIGWLIKHELKGRTVVAIGPGQHLLDLGPLGHRAKPREERLRRLSLSDADWPLCLRRARAPRPAAASRACPRPLGHSCRSAHLCRYRLYVRLEPPFTRLGRLLCSLKAYHRLGFPPLHHPDSGARRRALARRLLSTADLRRNAVPWRFH